jgi:hypothetical protein
VISANLSPQRTLVALDWAVSDTYGALNSDQCAALMAKYIALSQRVDELSDPLKLRRRTFKYAANRPP